MGREEIGNLNFSSTILLHDVSILHTLFQEDIGLQRYDQSFHTKTALVHSEKFNALGESCSKVRSVFQTYAHDASTGHVEVYYSRDHGGASSCGNRSENSNQPAPARSRCFSW